LQYISVGCKHDAAGAATQSPGSLVISVETARDLDCLSGPRREGIG
jgi:hypothetical protein